MEEKIMINIFGPSTAGKSTIAELLEANIDRLYTVDFDIVKRQISGYDWKRDSEIAQEVTFDTVASVAKTELPILLLLPPPTLQKYDRLAAIANSSPHKLLDVEITAPVAVLVQRYEQRMDAVRESGSKWKFKTLDEFKAKLQDGYYRPDNTYSFNSSEMSPDAIFQKIKELM